MNAPRTKPHIEPLGYGSMRWVCHLGTPIRDRRWRNATRKLAWDVGWPGFGGTPAEAFAAWKLRNSTPPPQAA